MHKGWNDPKTPPAPDPLVVLRLSRNRILRDSDWTQLPDSPLSDEKKSEWATYRQALRDLPGSFPDAVWPEVPE